MHARSSPRQTRREHAYGRDYALRICTLVRVSCAIDSPKKLDRGITASPRRAWPPLLCPDLRSPSIDVAAAALANTHSPKVLPAVACQSATRLVCWTANAPHF